MVRPVRVKGADLQMRLRVSRSILAVMVPLIVCVALNAVVRPWLADGLGGKTVRSGASVRGSDRWWSFDAQTQVDHPALTAFLTLSDGALGMLTFAVIAVLLIGIWVTDQLRSPRQRPDKSVSVRGQRSAGLLILVKRPNAVMR